MNENRIEQELRRHLRERADIGPDVDVLRDSVRRRLDTRASRPRAAPARRPNLAVAASLIVLVGILGVGLAWSIGRDDATLEEVTELPSTPSTSTTVATGGQAIDTTQLSVSLTLAVPDVVDRDVININGDNTLLELSLAGPATAEPPRVPMLRVVVAPQGATTESIVTDVTASLVDTQLIEVADSQLGGWPTRMIRLESDLGSTVIGLKIGPGVFVSASGIDRTYELHVIETSQGPIVVWIDAASDSFEAVRRDADLIVSTLQVP